MNGECEQIRLRAVLPMQGESAATACSAANALRQTAKVAVDSGRQAAYKLPPNNGKRLCYIR